MRVRVFKLCVYLQRVKVYCLQVNQDAIIYFAFFFPFFLFSISHSNVIHREICIEDFQKLLHLGNLVQTLDTTTLQCRYYAVPYNAETVITRLVCDSHFLCSFFPNFESFALLPRKSAVKKIVNLADLHILFYQSCHLYFAFWLFQTQNRCHIFHSST